MPTLFIGICPHDAGIYQAEEVEVAAQTIAEALVSIREQITGGRYVSRVIRAIDHITVWEETHGSLNFASMHLYKCGCQDDNSHADYSFHDPMCPYREWYFKVIGM